jgi:nucleoside-diphosphate-sugar epimerase
MINLGRDSVANYVYVGDVVDTMVRLGGLPLSHGEVFIVNDPVPMVEFVAAAADALEVPVPSRRAPMWLVFPIAALLQAAHHVLRTPAPLTIQRVKALATRTCFSADKLNSVTGTPMRFGYRQGLQRTVQAYRAQKRAA